MNETHNAEIRSWVVSANAPGTEFPLQNLPFGVFRTRSDPRDGRAGIALGDFIIDIPSVAARAPFSDLARQAAAAAQQGPLNDLMALGPSYWTALRHDMFNLFRNDHADSERHRGLLESTLVPRDEVEMDVPARIGDYSDFYASLFHATNVGTMLRPENPLFPNYKHIPIGYHGRSSSIVVSGSPVRRPQGQTREDPAAGPTFGPSASLDYELELGIFVGAGNPLGTIIPMHRAEQHLFGVCLLNDWSARDIQRWEYQPLGPFLAKSFCTTISPWIVTSEALEPFRVPAFARPGTDPLPLPHLDSRENRERGGIDITVEVFLRSETMRGKGMPPTRLSRGTFADMYWTAAQMITHHASNGCNLRPGDLLGSGTISGKEKESRGCLLELTWRGNEPLALPSGESRRFLADGDEVLIRGRCERKGFVSIGFGECAGVVLPSSGTGRDSG